MLQDYMKLSW